MSLERTEDERSPAEYLAEQTGRPVEEFEYDGEIPDFDEQEIIYLDDEE